MKEFWNYVQMVFTAIGGWLGWFLGGCDGLLYTLIAFVAIDYITGVMCAINNHSLSSEVGFRGICCKVLIFLLIGIANILDVNVIGTGSVLRTAVIFFYISNEGVSLMENAAHLGLPVPEKIKVVLEQLHDRAEDKEDKYPMSGKVFCGECGSPHKRRMNYSTHIQYPALTCSGHLKDKSSCSQKFIREDALQMAFVTMMNKLIFAHKEVLQPLLTSLRSISQKDAISRLSELDERLEKNAERQNRKGHPQIR